MLSAVDRYYSSMLPDLNNNSIDRYKKSGNIPSLYLIPTLILLRI